MASSAIWVILAPQSLALEVAALISIGELIAIPVVWVFGPMRHGAGWRTLGFRGAQARHFLWGCGVLAVMFLVNYLFSLILMQFGTSIQPGIETVITGTDFPLWLIAAGVLIGPLSEEILFRGFVFGGLETKYGWGKAALVSSLAFAVLHFQPTALLPLFVIGFLLCYLYYATNSLWPSLVVHAAMNALALLGAFLLSTM
jgi:hypothetical protein